MGNVADIVMGFAGSMVLAAVYYGFAFQWPGTYRNLADTFGLDVTQRLWRLLAFRSAPVFLTGILVWHVSQRLGGTGWLSVGIMITIHVGFSNGRAFVRSFLPGRPESAINYASYHLSAGLIAIAAAVVSSVLAPFASDFVPSTQSLIDAFWTTLFLAVAAGVVLRVTGNDSPERDPRSTSYWEKRALADTSVETFDMIFASSATAQADPMLVKSFAIMEILQRPSWVRRTERLLSGFRKSGSYGIMQIQSSDPISDTESVSIFAAQISGQTFFELYMGDSATPIKNRLWGIAGRHNGDKVFYDGVERLYYGQLYRIRWLNEEGSQGSIGIVGMRRYATKWGLRIASTSDEIVVKESDSGSRYPARRPETSESGSWWYVEVEIPIEVERVQVTEPNQSDAPVFSLQIDDAF